MAQIRVCPVCMRSLAMDEEHPEHQIVTLRILKEGGRYKVEASDRICRGSGHEYIVSTVENVLNKGFRVPETRVWVTEQLQAWKNYANMSSEAVKAEAERAKARVRESIERIRKWAEQRKNDAGAQRWAQKKIAELTAELESIDARTERVLKAIENSRRMLYGE